MDNGESFLLKKFRKSFRRTTNSISILTFFLVLSREGAADDEVTAFSDEEIEAAYGKEKMQSVYQAAKAQLEKMNHYFSKYPARIFNVDAKLVDNEIIAAKP